MVDIKLVQIELEGFKIFTKKQTFVISRDAALYFIGGQNHVHPRLGSNAVGKSSLISAISWVLFGRTVEGLKAAKDVKNWHSKSCSVSLDLLKDNVASTITRTINPNSIKLNTVEKTQPELDEFLGLDYEQFLYMLIVGQFNTCFLDLEPTPRLNLLCSIMGIDLWDKCIKETSNRCDILAKDVALLETRLAGAQERQEALKSEQATILSQQQAFAEQKSDIITQALLKLSCATKELEQIELERAHQTTLLTNKQQENVSTDDDISRIETNIQLINQQRFEMEKSITSLQAYKASATQDFSKWKSISNHCPFCLQSVPSEMVNQHKTKHTKQILDLDKDIKRIQKTLGELEDQLVFNQDKLQEIKAHAALRQKEIELLSISVNKTITKLQLKQQEIHQQKKSLQEETDRSDPYATLLSNSELQINDHQTKLIELDGKLVQLKRDLNGTKFWVKGFKEIKVWLVSDAASVLEAETNAAAERLGLIGWKVQFPVEKETSTGDIAKGLHVLIHSSGFKEDRYVPFASWSGGEAQRLRLASVKGISNLIRAYKAVDFNFRAYDEPTSYLSDDGIDDLLGFLDDEAIENQKAVYLIDQRHLESDHFKDVIIVENTNKGSMIAP